MGQVPLLRVRQWLSSWDSFSYDEELHQSKPPSEFYVASIPAAVLRRLAYVSRRHGSGKRILDIGIQRTHEGLRSKEIRRFVDAGYPWASLPKRDQDRYPNLKKPGWLPTAIVANVIGPNSERSGRKIDPRDLVTIETQDGQIRLMTPDGSDQSNWALHGELHPIEIIDGQHRLLAFEEGESVAANYDLPVVLFNDLDISWQAYLFWTINIRPKRISQSFAFDLYPLLRTQDWLEGIEGPATYRETRAQELTEALWSHPSSPWHNRISMLGKGRTNVSQAAWVRSLTVTFVKPWEGSGTGPGGLFGAAFVPRDSATILAWNRPQQAAYLIRLWSDLEANVKVSAAAWVQSLLKYTLRDAVPSGGHAAFSGNLTLLNTDQGVRGVLHVMNDFSFVLHRELELSSWTDSWIGDYINEEDVTQALASLNNQDRIIDFTRRLGAELAKFDWRSARTEDLTSEERNQQLVYRTGTGYKQLRLDITRRIALGSDELLRNAANEVLRTL